ncbi:LysR substrate-binding domain-containing protein [Variovorax sp. LjRoot178]|uniref:LysR substrate-binding domain-containing protein n=1 Tax=Variovorax sp. LjRoot178 TaxID=3342277 RepID=UPI003ECE7453
MELRQLRYFVHVVELGSFTRAAADLRMVQSALSQQIARLEGELNARLLTRSAHGVSPTEAGLAFFREAQLTVRHAEQAVRAAQDARLSGTVSIGLPPTVASVLGVPLLRAMRERYPEVRVHLVESLSGYLANLLNARQLDLAVLYGSHAGHRWSVTPLLEEQMYFIQSAKQPLVGALKERISLSALQKVPLFLPSPAHGLRSFLDAAFVRARAKPQLAGEIDSLAMLMDAVDAGLGGTLQPASATRRYVDAAERFRMAEVDGAARRTSSLCSLSSEELSPAGVAARVVLAGCARDLVRSGAWLGAQPLHH